ncbi:hypothetical protein MRB53_031857 [Persea americana]|uniref:Uncharacterized protein n=1 Tax=Persea americana TaxID=3435 RepID=A0ACC2KQI8_PERAE|nr:hypothetical protein MRB53_031857 [Persea americana]
MNKLRFKPSLLLSGCRQRSISEVDSIQSKLHWNASLIRCYAAFNFVDDSSSEKRITDRGSVEKFPFEPSSGQQSPALSGHEVQVLQNLECSEPNYSEKDDDDDFAELGLPLVKMKKSSVHGEQSQKLMVNETEKDSIPPSVSSLLGKLRSSTKIPPKQNIHHPGLHFNLEDRNGVSRTKGGSEMRKKITSNIPSHKGSNCVIIEKVPLSITVSQLREAMSIHGEVSSAFMSRGHNGSQSCRIEFKTVESSERALVAQQVTVGNFYLEIHSLHAPEIYTVRISNISMDTAEPTIHSVCMSCGSVEGLWRMKEGYVDVLFSIKDHFAIQTVLKKLNDVRIHDCQWSPQLLPKNTRNSVINSSDAKQGVGSQISNLIRGLKEQLQMKRIHLEDLENLHHAIIHLKECPSASHNRSQELL